jgi:uncharacterized protein YggE
MNPLWATLVMAAALQAPGQEPALSTVVVAAVGKVEKPATALQFSFALKAKGDDLLKAVEALDAKKAAVLAKLKGMGVDEKDIMTNAPALERKDPDQMRMARQARSGSNRLKKKKEEDKAEKEPAAVALWLTARLPLKAKERAALFVESEQLKEKVKAAKLLEAEKKEPGEGDDDEEMLSRMNQYQEQQGMEDGFYFQFYAAMSPKDTEAALAKAMESAKSLAEAGARVAGKSLTGTVSLEIEDSSEEGASPRARYNYERYRNPVTAAAPGGVVSPSPEGLDVSVALKVTFGLK